MVANGKLTLTDKVESKLNHLVQSGKCEVCTEPFYMNHSPLRIKRHNVPCKVIYHALLMDNKHAKREQRCSGYDNSRPGDIFHPDFLLGHPGFFNVTVANSVQPSFIIKAASNAGAAAEAAKACKDFRHKMTKLQQLVVYFIHLL